MAKQILGKIGLIPKGKYNVCTQYNRLDFVEYNGSSYVALCDNLGVDPDNEETWQLMSLKGDKGDKPQNGIDYNTDKELEDFENEVINYSKSQLDNYVPTLKQELDSYESNKEIELNNNATQLIDNYNSNATNKTDDFNNNYDNKLSSFNSNYDTKISDFNSNVSTKENEFNSNVINKTENFDNNATNKTTDFNSNASDKLEEYNNNADERLDEYNNSVDSLINKADYLENVINSLQVETNYQNEIIVENAVEYPLQAFNGKGKSQQFATSGKNLFDEERAKNSTIGGSFNLIFDIQLKSNTQYTITRLVEETFDYDGKYYLYFNLQEDANNLSRFNLQRDTQDNPINTINQTITTGESGILRYMGSYATIDRINDFYNKVKVQIEEGSTATEYEPYTGGQPSPSPDYPQEIEITDGIRNLFDKNNSDIINAYINTNGVFKSVTDNSNYCIIVQIKPNTTYYIKKFITMNPLSMSRFRIGFCNEYPSNDTQLNSFVKYNDGVATDYISSTSCAEDNYMVLYLYYKGEGFTTTLEEMKDNLMISDKEITKKYFPYGNWLIYKNQGKNLLNLANGTYFQCGITAVVDNGKIILNGTATENSFLVIPFEFDFDDMVYTLSANNDGVVGSSSINETYACIRFMSYGNNTQVVTLGRQNNSISYNWFNIVQHITNLTIRTAQGITYNNFVIYPQLEKGNKSTSYEQYKQNKLDIPLNDAKFRSIDNVYDELIVDTKNGDYYKLQRIEEIDLMNSNVNWVITNSCFQSNEQFPSDLGNLKKALCNYFKVKYYESGITSLLENGYFGWNNQKKITFKNNDLLTVDEWNDWILNNNIVLNYVLAEPTLSKIGTLTPDQLKQLVLFDGYNDISVETNLGLMDIKIKYVQDLKSYIEEIISQTINNSSTNVIEENN